MFDQNRFTELLNVYLDGSITEQEQRELFTLTAFPDSDRLLEQKMDRDLEESIFPVGKIEAEEADLILKNIVESEENNRLLFKKTARKRYIRVLAVAAAMAGVLLAWTYFFAPSDIQPDPNDFAALIPKGNVSKVNTSSKPVEIRLEDGTLVRLQPHSSLSYPSHFPNGEREVYMTGEAFFDVAKDPSKPFLVYYNNIVTRVLGTSFTIRTDMRTNNVEVSVRTGKVQVTENKNMTKRKSEAEPLKGVILKPNQKTVYNVLRRDFAITLADSIYTLTANDIIGKNKIESAPISFRFEKPTNLEHIFNQLESMYGIEIVVTNESIYRCVFTGDISSQEMMKKMQILCLTIGAAFEVNGTKILVSGKGCK